MSNLTLSKFIITPLLSFLLYTQTVLSYQCPVNPHCQTLDACMRDFRAPEQMVWGPCEGCSGNTGMCLAKAADVCLSPQKTNCDRNEQQIPQCTSGKKGNNTQTISTFHICGAFPCCGVEWVG